MERGSLPPLVTVLLLICQFQWFVVDAAGETCDLPAVRDASKNTLPGGWRVINSTAGRLVAERAITNLKSSGSNPDHLVKHHRVIEAFSQVVQGTNYCVYFSASGKCDDYHCKSFECTAKGHLSLTSRDDNIEVQDSGVQCQEQTVCDFERVAQLAQNPMPGGWHRAGNQNDVDKLHHTASAIATVEQGVIVEAYSQVVAGFNYCMKFRSKGAANCAANCQSVTCTASGFSPLAHQTTNADSLIRVGVNCQPDRPALLLNSNASSGRLMAHGVATLLIIALANFF